MDSYDPYGEDLPLGGSPRPFDTDGYTGYDPRLASGRFDPSFREGFVPDQHFVPEDNEEVDDGGYVAPAHGFDDTPPAYRSPFDDDISTGGGADSASPFGQPSELSADDFPHTNGKGFGHTFEHEAVEVESAYVPYAPPPAHGSLDGAVLPPPEEMQPEEGFILREWRRKNAIHLEEKTRQERERLSQIIDAADAFKDAFYEKRKLNYEANKKNNRDKEKVFLETLTNFHATADKHYWKAIAELVPHELPNIESKSKGNKDKKPSVVINHGPKPGKATDITRMRQVLVKLKHNPPAHMKAPPAAPVAAAKPEGADAKSAPQSGAAIPVPKQSAATA